MKDIELIRMMAAKLNGVMLLELNMRTPKGLEALRSLMNGNLESSREAELTAREREILALIAEGMTNKMIAQELDISDSTVKVHVKNVLRKLKVNSRLAAAVHALRPRQANGSEWSQEYERN